MRITLITPVQEMLENAHPMLAHVAEEVASQHPWGLEPDSAQSHVSQNGRDLITMRWGDLFVRVIDITNRAAVSVSSSRTVRGGYLTGSGLMLPYGRLTQTPYRINDSLWEPDRFERWPR